MSQNGSEERAIDTAAARGEEQATDAAGVGGEEPASNAPAAAGDDSDSIRALIKSLGETVTNGLAMLTERFDRQYENIADSLRVVEEHFEAETDPTDVVPRSSMFSHLKKIWSKEMPGDGDATEVSTRPEDGGNRYGSYTWDNGPDKGVLGPGQSLAVDPKHAILTAEQQDELLTGRRPTRAASAAARAQELARVQGLADHNDAEPEAVVPLAVGSKSSKGKPQQTKTRKRKAATIDEEVQDQDVKSLPQEQRKKKSKKGTKKAKKTKAAPSNLQADSDQPQKQAPQPRGQASKQRADSTSGNGMQSALPAPPPSLAMAEGGRVHTPADEVQTLDDAHQFTDDGVRAINGPVQATGNAISLPGMYAGAINGDANRDSRSFTSADFVDGVEASTADEARRPRKRSSVYSPGTGAHQPAMRRRK